MNAAASIDEAKERIKVRSMFSHEFPVLYHGTSVASLPEIAAKGLLPRGGGTKNNWEHTIGSHEETVYLTDSYAMYFAFCAEKEGEGGAVLEIDTAMLDPNLFVPDEDFLEQASRGMHVAHTPGWLSKSEDMKRRTLWFRQHANWFPPEISLRGLGTVGYRGRIPYAAVKRTAIFEHDLMMEASMVFDPTITVLNYKILGARYRAATRSIFGEKGAGYSLAESMKIGGETRMLHEIDTVDSLSSRPRIETNPVYGEVA
jgi:hypothetical protein